MEIHFGERPLAQTEAAAAALRRLTALLLSQEQPQPVVEEMLPRFAEWERALTATAPADPRPRVGDAEDDPERRIYLDHAFDIGTYNPSFPEYVFDTIDPASATGRVTFPVNFEGPPGLVHGGFLGVFFDCVVQQHSCAAGVTGKTKSLAITYRRPTPLRTELGFSIARTVTEAGIESNALLRHGEEVLCRAAAVTVAVTPEHLAGTRYGRRRVSGAPTTEGISR
ncbi:PaaI family thioesterase [Nocardia jiangsuensis]|uniref:PaaI family thioesterase n=1 Tax=Nocardia jiangsuensis TaxID=1691563 RepID=A0ABV8DLQ1_9NOCA